MAKTLAISWGFLSDVNPSGQFIWVKSKKLTNLTWGRARYRLEFSLAEGKTKFGRGKIHWKIIDRFLYFALWASSGNPPNYLISILSASSVYRDMGRLPFTSSIRVEILGVNIQCWSLSKRKTEISQNVLVSIRKFTKNRKNALIKPVVYNLWNVSNGMVCTISFSNQNFQAFRVNGKCPCAFTWNVRSNHRQIPKKWLFTRR